VSKRQLAEDHPQPRNKTFRWNEERYKLPTDRWGGENLKERKVCGFTTDEGDVYSTA